MDNNLGISMRAVLQLEPLAGAEVLAGAAGLSRTVTSVNVMEVPDIVDWVAPGQVLLTTAFSFKSDPQGLFGLIPRLNQAGVAGFGVKLGRYIEAVPPEVLAEAERLAFPLFTIPAEVPFPAVISEVLTGIVSRQAQVLEKIEDLNRALTRTMLHGGNLQEIGQIFYRRFGNSVAILSDYLSSYVLNTTDDKRERIRAIVEAEKRGAQADAPAQPGVYTVQDEIDENCCRRIVVPIYSDDTLYGRLYMWEDHRAVGDVERSAIESATSLIALYILRRMSMLELENSNRSGFLSDLLSAERKQVQKALANARFFDFDPRAGHRVVLIQLKDRAARTGPAKSGLHRFDTNLAGLLQHAVRGSTAKVIYANTENRVVLLFETTTRDGVSRVQSFDDFVTRLYRQFATEGLAGILQVCAGREYFQAGELHRSLAEAKRVLAGPRAADGQKAVLYENTGIWRLLAHEGVRAEGEAFAADTLRPLLAYDEAKDAQLARTMTQYFACGGNLTRMAETLGVHYNTVVNRLARVQELLDLDLTDAQAALDLQVALEIYRMQGP